MSSKQSANYAFGCELTILGSLCNSLDILKEYIKKADKIVYDHTIFFPYLWICSFYAQKLITEDEKNILLTTLRALIKRFIILLKESNYFFLYIYIESDPFWCVPNIRGIRKYENNLNFAAPLPLCIEAENMLISLLVFKEEFLSYMVQCFKEEDYIRYDIARIVNYNQNGPIKTKLVATEIAKQCDVCIKMFIDVEPCYTAEDFENFNLF